MNWTELLEKINRNEPIYLYAGGVPEERLKTLPFIGLSLFDDDEYHIMHDVTEKMPIPDNSVDIYQSEDVFEHINFFKLLPVINEIHRVLKPDGLFRLSMPDYRCDRLYKRCLKDPNGNILFDGLGGGALIDNREITEVHGHVWFPKHEIVKLLLHASDFEEINFLHFYSENGTPITRTIDYSKGHISRTPDHATEYQNPYRPGSIVVDCYKRIKEPTNTINIIMYANKNKAYYKVNGTRHKLEEVFKKMREPDDLKRKLKKEAGTKPLYTVLRNSSGEIATSST